MSDRKRDAWSELRELAAMAARIERVYLEEGKPGMEARILTAEEVATLLKHVAEWPISLRDDKPTLLLADSHEALRSRLGEETRRADELEELLDAQTEQALLANRRAERLEARLQELEETLRAIGEGNLGDKPGQADYDRLREFARAALDDQPGPDTSRPRHNHRTRDMKPPGACPACDLYHNRPA